VLVQSGENPGRRKDHRYRAKMNNVVRSSLRGWAAYITELRSMLSGALAVPLHI
jgi:hypothetical protein